MGTYAERCWQCQAGVVLTVGPACLCPVARSGSPRPIRGRGFRGDAVTTQKIIQIGAEEPDVPAPLDARNRLGCPPIIDGPGPDAEVLGGGGFGEELGFGRPIGRPGLWQNRIVHAGTLGFRGSSWISVSRAAKGADLLEGLEQLEAFDASLESLQAEG